MRHGHRPVRLRAPPADAICAVGDELHPRRVPIVVHRSGQLMTERVGTRFSQDDRGAVLPIVALSLAVLMVMTAFSVDIGRQMMRRREAQGSADVIALDLARLVDGRTRSAIEIDPTWDQTRRDAAARNNFPQSGVSADLSHWDEATQTFTSSNSGEVPDA